MRVTRTLLTLAISLGLVGGMSRCVLADEWDQKTVVAFSGPVEIPGQVLPAGTYVFKVADSQSDRNIVQVFSNDERHLYGTFLAIPDQRLRPAGKTIVTFDERAAGAPEAVKAWFYPGDLYPKPRAVALAKANSTPVPSTPAELASNTTMPVAAVTEPAVTAMRQAPLKAQQPTEEEVEVAEVFVAPDPSSLPSRLPRTASPLPLLGLAGILALGAAGIIRVVRRTVA